MVTVKAQVENIAKSQKISNISENQCRQPGQQEAMAELLESSHQALPM